MSQRSPITTHVLDTARGLPAQGVPVKLFRRDGHGWSLIAEGVTDEDGRIGKLLPPGKLTPGAYQVNFDTRTYMNAQGNPVFYPEVNIHVQLLDPGAHYHIPLLLSPYGYSTYRGS